MRSQAESEAKRFLIGKVLDAAARSSIVFTPREREWLRQDAPGSSPPLLDSLARQNQFEEEIASMLRAAYESDQSEFMESRDNGEIKRYESAWDVLENSDDYFAGIAGPVLLSVLPRFGKRTLGRFAVTALGQTMALLGLVLLLFLIVALLEAVGTH